MKWNVKLKSVVFYLLLPATAMMLINCHLIEENIENGTKNGGYFLK